MPIIHREEGYQVVIWTRDHPPPHVHVFDSDGEVIIELGDEQTAPAIRLVKRMRGRSVVRAYRIVQAHQASFLADWRSIHGS
jgi:hypothetical protein